MGYKQEDFQKCTVATASGVPLLKTFLSRRAKFTEASVKSPPRRFVQPDMQNALKATLNTLSEVYTLLQTLKCFSHALTEECEGVTKRHFPVSQTVSQETRRAMSAVAPLCGFPMLCCREWKSFRGCTRCCERPPAASLGSKLPHSC